MYVLHLRHLAMTWSVAIGTGSSTSCNEEYGCMISAKGSLDFLRSEFVVGTAFNVERMYFGGQFAFSDAVTLV